MTKKSGKQINFKIDSLTRATDDEIKALTFYGTKIELEHNIERELLIPGKNKFKHLATHLKDTKNQVIEVNFSDPLKKNQNFSVQLKKLLVLQHPRSKIQSFELNRHCYESF